MKILSTVVLLALLPLLALATEVDNFTNRDVPLTDHLELLNFKMNTSILASADQVNSKYDCDLYPKKAEELFYRRLDKKIGGFFFARIEKEIENDPSIDKRYLRRKESIYQDLSIIQGFALRLAVLGSIVNVGGHLVGTDKLGHFTGVGKIYFDKMRKNKASLEQAMYYGVKSERTFFGLQTTGVYSYGDLTANYEGLLFWQSLFSGSNPIIKCVEGELIPQRGFEWLDHVSEAWDESINCSAFRTQSIEDRVYEAAGTTCPVAPMRQEIIKRYSHLTLRIINPKGH